MPAGQDASCAFLYIGTDAFYIGAVFVVLFYASTNLFLGPGDVTPRRKYTPYGLSSCNVVSLSPRSGVR